jgi:hypothetical protein
MISVEDDVTITQEDLNTGKQTPYMENSQTPYKKNHVDEESSLWLSAGYVCPEMEGFAVTIHDRVVKNRNYQRHCLRVEISDRYRKYGTVGETIEHY